MDSIQDKLAGLSGEDEARRVYEEAVRWQDDFERNGILLETAAVAMADGGGPRLKEALAQVVAHAASERRRLAISRTVEANLNRWRAEKEAEEREIRAFFGGDPDGPGDMDLDLPDPDGYEDAGTEDDREPDAERAAVKQDERPALYFGLDLNPINLKDIADGVRETIHPEEDRPDDFWQTHCRICGTRTVGDYCPSCKARREPRHLRWQHTDHLSNGDEQTETPEVPEARA